MCIRDSTDVVLSLAKKNDINVINVDGPQQELYKKQLSRREELYKILRVSKDWFKTQLNNNLGKEAYKNQLSRREELYKILRVSKDWFKSQLNNSLGKEALYYLKSQRNLNTKNINDFELGYAPNSWNDLLF